MTHFHLFRRNEASASNDQQRKASAESRAAMSNVVAATMTNTPDTNRVFSSKVSYKDYDIHIAKRGVVIGGGTAGTWAGMAVGSYICPGVGTAIEGFIGGMLGGIGGSKAASKCLR